LARSLHRVAQKIFEDCDSIPHQRHLAEDALGFEARDCHADVFGAFRDELRGPIDLLEDRQLQILRPSDQLARHRGQTPRSRRDIGGSPLVQVSLEPSQIFREREEREGGRATLCGSSTSAVDQ
jgi:hypothetical protein